MLGAILDYRSCCIGWTLNYFGTALKRADFLLFQIVKVKEVLVYEDPI